MDNKPDKSGVKLYYKNLAKKQKKRWRARKLKKQERTDDPQRNAGEKSTDCRYVQSNLKEIDVTGLVKIGKSLGAGTFGHCNLANYRGMIVAVKEYKAQPKTTKQQLKNAVVQEAQVIAELGDHKNLPLLFGISTATLPYRMILQYHGIGKESITISKAVKCCKISLRNWVDIVKGVSAVLSHVHDKGYLHNDLKVNNVIVEKCEHTFNAIIIDFGKSSKVNDCRHRKKTMTSEEQLSYSQLYPHIAPEIVNGSDVPSTKSDIFSFGKLIQYLEEHSSIDIKAVLNYTAYKAALLVSPKMRPTIEQIVNLSD